MSVNEKMTAISDAIREKTGGTEALTLDDMALAVPEVFDGGKRAEREYFWNSAINDNTSGAYRFAGRCWNDETFRPTKSITLTGNCTAAFNGTQITDIVTAMGKNKMIVTDVTSAGNMFSNSQITRCPYINLSGATNVSYLFSYCSNLATIDGITFPISTSANVSNAFQGCSKLADITEVGGEIVINGLNFSPCSKLSHDSLMRIINALKKDGSTHSITFGTTNLNKLTDAEKAIAIEKGWSLG